MKDNTKLLIYILVASVLTLGIGIGGYIGASQKKEEPLTESYVETTESKLMMVAMRCCDLEQEVEALRLRIDLLEDGCAVTNDEHPVCGQFYLWNLGITNNLLGQEETNSCIPLAVDDLVD